MFTWLDLHLWCQPCWDSLKSLICLYYLLPFEGFSEALSGARPFFLCIPVSNKKTYIWCNVSCNVWLCMNEMSEHSNLFFIWTCFIPLSSFLVLTNAKCKCHATSHADECHSWPYQCNRQPLCPDMPLINFELLTLVSIFFLWMQTFYQNVIQAHIFYSWCKCFLQRCKCKILWRRCPLWRCKCNFPWCKCPLRGCECKIYSW